MYYVSSKKRLSGICFHLLSYFMFLSQILWVCKVYLKSEIQPASKLFIWEIIILNVAHTCERHVREDATAREGKESTRSKLQRIWYDWIYVCVILPCSLPAF